MKQSHRGSWDIGGTRLQPELKLSVAQWSWVEQSKDSHTCFSQHRWLRTDGVAVRSDLAMRIAPKLKTRDRLRQAPRVSRALVQVTGWESTLVLQYVDDDAVEAFASWQTQCLYQTDSRIGSVIVYTEHLKAISEAASTLSLTGQPLVWMADADEREAMALVGVLPAGLGHVEPVAWLQDLSGLGEYPQQTLRAEPWP